MTDCPVSFDGVWKKFRRGERARGSETDFWALQDVSFKVTRGEALGIIGPNGAGKSTALKLLTRIMRPTRGTCQVRGRVGALIEVASGFHPDFSGRENIYLQGAIMGMPRADITRKLDDIIEFSGLSDFIDTQVKRYSSGMNARLGFSIAANLEPDVLLIDEVLAVGDMAFQQRCIDRMEEFRDNGAAVVFVSHDLQAVASLCQRAIFLKSTVRAEGPAHEVIHAYITSARPPVREEATPIRITSALLLDDAQQPLQEVVSPGHRLTLRISLLPIEEIEEPSFLLRTRVYRTADNLMVDEGEFSSTALGVSHVTRSQPIELCVAFNANVTRGHYHVRVVVVSPDDKRLLASGGPALVFAVDEKQTWAGVTSLDVRASTGGDG